MNPDYVKEKLNRIKSEINYLDSETNYTKSDFLNSVHVVINLLYEISYDLHNSSVNYKVKKR